MPKSSLAYLTGSHDAKVAFALVEKNAAATNLRSLINAVPAAAISALANPVAVSALGGGVVGALGSGGAAALSDDPDASAIRSALAGGALGAGAGALGAYAGPKVIEALKRHLGK